MSDEKKTEMCESCKTSEGEVEFEGRLLCLPCVTKEIERGLNSTTK